MTSVVEVNPKVQAAPAVSAKAAIALGAGIAVCGAASFASLGMIASVKADVKDISAAETTGLNVWMSADTAKTTLAGTNVCAGAKPTSGWDNMACYVDSVATLIEQAGGDVTMNGDGTFTQGGNDAGDVAPIGTPYFQAGLCPVNVHWHLGAEHLSVGQYDDKGKGPANDGGNDVSDEDGYNARRQLDGRRLEASKKRLGHQCMYYDASDQRFNDTLYKWETCEKMLVGETYEIHWPHSAAGAPTAPSPVTR